MFLENGSEKNPASHILKHCKRHFNSAQLCTLCITRFHCLGSSEQRCGIITEHEFPLREGNCPLQLKINHKKLQLETREKKKTHSLSASDYNTF